MICARVGYDELERNADKAEELWRVIEQEIANPKHREIFLLHYRDGISYERIAAVYDESLDNIAKIMSRIREILKKYYHPKDRRPPS